MLTAYLATCFKLWPQPITLTFVRFGGISENCASRLFFCNSSLGLFYWQFVVAIKKINFRTNCYVYNKLSTLTYFFEMCFLFAGPMLSICRFMTCFSFSTTIVSVSFNSLSVSVFVVVVVFLDFLIAIVDIVPIIR